jgi:hypothetical protein
MNKLDTGGKRAVFLIHERCAQTRTPKGEEYEKLGIYNSGIINFWKEGRNDPSFYYLRNMALAGYDVKWILLGGERNG